MFPSTLDSAIPEDEFCRVLAKTLPKLNLKSVYDLYKPCGGVGYFPVHLLSVVLFGLTRGMRTGKQLEECCSFDAGGHCPDERTFERFLARIDAVVDDIMIAVLDEAGRRGLARADEVAADGTKIAANVSW